MGSGTSFNFKLCQEKTPDPFSCPEAVRKVACPLFFPLWDGRLASKDCSSAGIGIDDAEAWEAEEHTGKVACPLFLSFGVQDLTLILR